MKVEEVFKINDGLNLLFERNLDSDVLLDIVDNSDKATEVVEKFKKVFQKVFEKYKEHLNEKGELRGEKRLEYDKEIYDLTQKDVKIDFIKLKYDVLKDEDGKVHGLLFMNLRPIIER